MPRRTGTALLVLATCLGVQSVVAQVRAGPSRMSFGIVGGLNLATISAGNLHAGDSAPPFKNRTGFHAGLAANIPLGTSLFFQPQALFSMRGYNYSEDTFYGVVSEEAKLSYLEVPLFLGLRIPTQGGGLRPYVMAGPSIGILVGCKAAWTESGQATVDDCMSSTKSTDFGIAFGAGIEMPMGSGFLTLGARYTMGLSDLAKNSSAGDATVKNRVISFGVGYFFGAGTPAASQPGRVVGST